MSNTIAQNLQTLKQHLNETYDAIKEKGVDVEDNQKKISSIANCISSIVVSGGDNWSFGVANGAILLIPPEDWNGVFECSSIGSYGMSYAFSGNTSLQEVSFPNLTTIGNSGMRDAFRNCTSLTSLSFPSLTDIEEYGMYYTFQNTSLSSISFPSLTTIGRYGMYYTFYGCTSLTEVSFPSLSSIGVEGMISIFQNCTSLTSISFPSLTTLGGNVFGYSYGSGYCFQNCTNLQEIHFRSDVQSTIEEQGGYSSKFGATNATIFFDL